MRRNFVVSILSIFVLLKSINAQTDHQWYISNGLYVVNNDFFVNGLSYPCVSCNQNARKDILVIYDNGLHYNSRTASTIITNSGYNTGLYSFKFIPTYPVGYTGSQYSIKYLYLTNIYQGDDPPDGISITTSPSLPILHPSIQFSVTDMGTRKIAANHDVVKNKDITIILSLKNIHSSSFPLKLKFNSLIKISDGSQILLSNTFDESKVFNNQCYFGGFTPDPLSTTSPEISIPSVPTGLAPFLYINLRPTSDLQDYFPTQSGTPSHKIVFELFSSTNTRIDSIQEELRDSHDPNFIRVEKICMNAIGEKYVYYHAQFQNTSLQPQNNLKIGFNLPDIFDKRCITALDWNVGGTSIKDSKSKVRVLTRIEDGLPNDQRRTHFQSPITMVSFIFDENKFIQTCSSADPVGAIGYVKFCVKVKNPNLDLESHTVNLELSQSHTYFGSSFYPITDFFDICYKDKSTDFCRRSYSTKSDCLCKCKKKRWWPF